MPFNGRAPNDSRTRLCSIGPNYSVPLQIFVLQADISVCPCRLAWTKTSCPSSFEIGVTARWPLLHLTLRGSARLSPIPRFAQDANHRLAKTSQALVSGKPNTCGFSFVPGPVQVNIGVDLAD